MNYLPRQLLIVFCTLSFQLSLIAKPVDVSVIQSISLLDLVEKINNLRTENSEKAIELCKIGYEYYMSREDTLASISLLLAESSVYGHKAQYQKSYDRIWTAYLLANKTANEKALVDTKLTLGRYYSFYKRETDAVNYLIDALAINKKLQRNGEIEDIDIVNNYYLIAKTHRELSNPELAKNYLDSCNLYNGNEHNYIRTLVRVEEAILSSDPQKGIHDLNSLLPKIEQNQKGYQVLIYKYIGDKYLELGLTNKAQSSFLKAIDLSDKYNSHKDFSPLIYNSLAKLYSQTGQFQKAYQAVMTEKNLDELYFDSRSANNRSLLFIRDKYQEELEKSDKLIQQQKLDKLELEEREAFLNNVVLSIFLLSLLLCGTVYFFHIKNKHTNEKRLLQKKKELEMTHTNELLELKNRELALSSLKLIEKDELLASLKEQLASGNGDIKRDDLKKIVRSISHSNSQNWEEFETSFISVNRDFYNKLNKKYPKLTNGDQKLCSLIKLNMSSKEMAKLLGISIESVHTNRYRLRKKLALSRDTSLTEFVASL